MVPVMVIIVTAPVKTSLRTFGVKDMVIAALVDFHGLQSKVMKIRNCRR